MPSAPLTHNKLECGSWRAIVAGPASSGSDALIVAVERSTIESAALPSRPYALTASVDDDCDDIRQPQAMPVSSSRSDFTERHAALGVEADGVVGEADDAERVGEEADRRREVHGVRPKG